jgi:hypothetical protein
MKPTNLIVSGLLALSGSAAMAGGGPLDLSSGSVGFSSTPATGSFDELYTFTLGSSAIVTSSVTSVVNGPQNIEFHGMTLSGPSGVFSFVEVLPDPFETWALSATPLAAGSYTLSIFGVNSPEPASYGGNISASFSSSVPEPHIYAMLLAGVCVVGFMATRQKSRAP